jgi:hypothetical protein
VVIQRHPLRTLDSQVRAWRDLVVRQNPYLTLIDRGYRTLFDDLGRRMRLGMFLHSQAGVDWLADNILRAHLGFLSLRSSWPGDNLLILRYEDLCADQRSTLAHLSAFLEIKFPEPHRPAPRDGAVSNEAQRAFAARREKFAPYLECYGYSAERV